MSDYYLSSNVLEGAEEVGVVEDQEVEAGEVEVGEVEAQGVESAKAPALEEVTTRKKVILFFNILKGNTGKRTC